MARSRGGTSSAVVLLTEEQITALSPTESAAHVLELQQHAAPALLQARKRKVRAELNPHITSLLRRVKYVNADAFDLPLADNRSALRIIKRLNLLTPAAEVQFYGNWKDTILKMHTDMRNALLASVKKIVNYELLWVMDDEQRAEFRGLDLEGLKAEFGRGGKLSYIIEKLARSAKNGPKLGSPLSLIDALANDEAFLRAAAAYVVLNIEWCSKAGSRSTPHAHFKAHFSDVFYLVKAERETAAALATESAASTTRITEISELTDDDDDDEGPPLQPLTQRTRPSPSPTRGQQRDSDEEVDGAAAHSTAGRVSLASSRTTATRSRQTSEGTTHGRADPPAAQKRRRSAQGPPTRSRG